MKCDCMFLSMIDQNDIKAKKYSKKKKKMICNNNKLLKDNSQHPCGYKCSICGSIFYIARHSLDMHNKRHNWQISLRYLLNDFNLLLLTWQICSLLKNLHTVCWFSHFTLELGFIALESYIALPGMCVVCVRGLFIFLFFFCEPVESRCELDRRELTE